MAQKRKVTVYYERYLRVFYPSVEWACQGCRPEIIPERELLDIPCDDMEKAKAIKQKIIAEEKAKEEKAGHPIYMLQVSDDIEAYLYWHELKVEEEILPKEE